MGLVEQWASLDIAELQGADRSLSDMVEIATIWRGPAQLGESPVWDERTGRLYFIDGRAGLIWRCAPDGSDLRHWRVRNAIGSIALRDDGGAVLGSDAAFLFFDFDTSQAMEVARVTLPEGVRLNDGKVDPGGRFVCGSIDLALMSTHRSATPDLATRRAAHRLGGLYRLDHDLTVQLIASDIGCANGPCWSVDEETFYLSDSWTRTITAYDWRADLVMLPPGRQLSVVEEGYAVPDGATVDAEGCIWSAVALGGELRRYAPDGKLICRVKMPVSGVTSVTFGGAEMDVLFATSLTPRDRASSGLDGATFAVTGLGVTGLPARRFTT